MININSIKEENYMLTDQHKEELLASRPAQSVTKELVESKIQSFAFWRPSCDSTLTVCALKLKNGFEIVGESACASPENFDAELGKKIAYDDAVNKAFKLEGYLLKEALHIKSQNDQDGAKKTTESLIDTKAQESEALVQGGPEASAPVNQSQPQELHNAAGQQDKAESKDIRPDHQESLSQACHSSPDNEQPKDTDTGAA